MDDEEDYSSSDSGSSRTEESAASDSSSYSSGDNDTPQKDTASTASLSNSSYNEGSPNLRSTSSESYSMGSPLNQDSLLSPGSSSFSYSSAEKSVPSVKAATGEKAISPKPKKATVRKKYTPRVSGAPKSDRTPKMPIIKKSDIDNTATTTTAVTAKQAEAIDKAILKRKALQEHHHKLIAQSIRRPGDLPSTRLPPTTVPFVAADGTRNRNRLTERLLHNNKHAKKKSRKQLLNPTTVSVQHIDCSRVRLKWEPPFGVAPTSYRVKISEDCGKTFFITFSTRVRNVEIPDLEPNTTYHATVLSIFDEKDLPQAASSPPRKHLSVHFVTRPLPQLHTDLVHLSPLRNRESPHLGLKSCHSQQSPLCSKLRFPSWLK
eukprot:TRINITY_DN6071_c1_g1_i1.p1 TRINITY_DN6071_c1_g1~~TRINITY_DN6071_c1_g1_i1.p1  ORF type:complete len:392 (+),score=66.54 TRINITY_DN6071_c1_g1_i1:51-1178(+)